MPTGYTDVISNGVTFKDFVMQCARAMGACIMMRDDPPNAEIPERFEPCDWNKKKFKEATASLKILQCMGVAAAREKAGKEFKAKVADHVRQIEEKEELRAKYLEMLVQVRQWQPPTPDHQGLKDFMIQQITDSIEFDCDISYYNNHPPKLFTGEEYLENCTTKALHDIDYHRKMHRDEVTRTEGRNVWVKQLRDSLKGE